MEALAPRRLTVFGVLGLVFGILSGIASLFMLASGALASNEDVRASQMQQAAEVGQLMDVEAFLDWQAKSNIYGGMVALLLNGLLIFAAILLLTKNQGGVALYCAQSVISFVLQLALAIFNLWQLFSIELLVEEDVPGVAVFRGFTIGVMAFAMLIPLIWMLVVLLNLNAKKVKEYFAQKQGLTTANAFTMPPVPPMQG